MTDSKGKLTDPAWLKNELNWAKGTDAEMKEAMLNQWTEPHFRLEHKSFMRQRIRDQREDKSALNSLVTGFLNSVKDQSHCEASPFKWTCIARHPEAMMFSDKKRCRYCKPTEIHEDDHPLFWRGGRPIYNDDLSWM
jgi:urocanate hydratase